MNNTTPTITLADIIKQKPSERIRFGLQALRDFEQTPGCVVKMSVFHLLGEDGVCFACLGGAASLQLIDKSHWAEVDVTRDVAIRIHRNTYYEVRGLENSLNFARLGDFASMFECMNLNPVSGRVYNRYIHKYMDDSQELFYADLEQVAAEMESDGY